MNIAIIGPSGCGKSTQAKMLAKEFNLSHFSIGGLIRKEMEDNTALGQELKSYVQQGTWAPDNLVMPVVEKALSSVNFTNFIVDGFPRLVTQGQLLDELLATHGQKLDAIVHLDITFAEIMARRQAEIIMNRTQFSDANRIDETPQAIAQRQQSYDDSISPILEYYQSQQRLVRTDATATIKVIFYHLKQSLSNYGQN